MSNQGAKDGGNTGIQPRVQSKTIKILSKVGKFIMYGGWMLLMVVILGIFIAASTCK